MNENEMDLIKNIMYNYKIIHDNFKEEFDELQPLYWGQTTKQQKYRFAIELPN